MGSGHRLPFDLFASAMTGVLRIADPGDGNAIIVDRNLGVVNLISTTGSQTRTLAAPTSEGLLVSMCLESITSGTLSVTVTGGFDQAGGTVLTFAVAGDYVMMQSVEVVSSTYVWRVIAFDGIIGPTVEIANLDVDDLQVDGTLDVDGLATLALLVVGDTATLSDVTATSLSLRGFQTSNQDITPETAANTVSLTDAQILGGILVATPTGTANYTVRTGTQIEAAANLLGVTLESGDSFDLTIINLGGAGNIITMLVASGVTFVGNVTIDDAGADINSSGTFRFVRGAANVFVAYRVS